MRYILAITILSGCALNQQKQTFKPCYTVSLCVTPDLVVTEALAGEEIQRLASSAITWWNNKVGKRVFVDAGAANLLDDNNPVAFTAIRVAGQERLSEWNKNTGSKVKLYYGGVHPNRCVIGSVIWLRDDGSQSKERLRYLILHELGHVLGLDHSIESDTLMNYKMHKYSQPVLGEDTKASLTKLY